ncbi:hypothetical protein [Streptomyces globosus]|uniref:hypothetical protein n=1 Tax=Streptomyces globosus TaxID=68209 RepID=UPI0031D1BD39
MTTTTIEAIEQATREAIAYHHPHFTGASTDRFNRLVLHFRPFTGAEEAPSRPIGIRRDEKLTAHARAFVDAEYDEAARLWFDAGYITALKRATDGATTLWDTYTKDRATMDRLFASMGSTPESHWRAAVSQLVAAQDKALNAAISWDQKALSIAIVHASFLQSDLTRAEAYKAASADASKWVVESHYEYDFEGGPLARAVQRQIDAQREHLRRVASLAGDRNPV